MYARVYTGFATPHFTLGYNCYYEFSFHQPDCKLINNKKKMQMSRIHAYF